MQSIRVGAGSVTQLGRRSTDEVFPVAYEQVSYGVYKGADGMNSRVVSNMSLMSS